MCKGEHRVQFLIGLITFAYKLMRSSGLKGQDSKDPHRGPTEVSALPWDAELNAN